MTRSVLAAAALLAACSPAPEPPRVDQASSDVRVGEPETLRAPADERVGLERATRLVEARMLEEDPDRRRPVTAALKEVTPEEVWERMGAQLFVVTEGAYVLDAWLVRGDAAWRLCTGFGGFGLHTALATDLDGDREPELTFTSSWGSGIHRSLVSVARFVEGELVIECPDVACLDDLTVERAADGRVVVSFAETDWTTEWPVPGEWVAVAELGTLTVRPEGGALGPVIELCELTDEQSDRLWPRVR